MPVEFVPLDELRHQLEVNVVGQVAVTQAFLPALRRAPGRIVFVGSIAGKSALPFLAPYAASKHALEAISDSLRLELRPWGIACLHRGAGDDPHADLGPRRGQGRRAAGVGGKPRGRTLRQPVAAFRRIAAKRGEGGAPPETVAKVVEDMLSAGRPRTRSLVGRDARIRAGLERLPARARDRVYERLLLGR